MKQFDPRDPDRLHATGVPTKRRYGVGLWLFLGVVAAVVAALVIF
jgi:hypothetical protein